MKKLLLSGMVIAAFVGYILFQRSGETRTQLVTPPKISTPQGQSASAANNGQTQQGVGLIYRDGQYTGVVADAYYGNLQVQAVIQNGRISDVVFLTYPSDRSQSVEINNQAMQYLKAEAIQAQSANVDIVSGATQSTQAFRQSLESALQQAKI